MLWTAAGIEDPTQWMGSDHAVENLFINTCLITVRLVHLSDKRCHSEDDLDLMYQI